MTAHSLNRAIEELGAGQYARDDLLDSKIEAAAVFSPKIIKRHEATHIFRRNRPAECPARQVFGNLPRACGLAGLYLRLRPIGLALRVGIANKDQHAARGPRNACGVVWPDDFDSVAKTRHAAVPGAESQRSDAAESG